MASPTKKLTYCFVLLLATFFTLTCASPPLYTLCRKSNFTSGSRYGRNINSLFSSLSSSTAPSSSGFYNLSYGRSPDTAYTLGLCRGDLSPQTCQSCIRIATSDLSQGCGNSKAGVIWYDECMLRYSNHSMYGRMETEPQISLYNVNYFSNPSQFNGVVRNLLDSLRELAVSGNSLRKFATGNVASFDLPRVYALVQCTPDLNATSCNNCLNDIIQGLPQCCDGKQGGRTLGPSCNFRYEIEPFYAGSDSSGAPTPAAEPASPPPPDSADTPTPAAEPASPPPTVSDGVPTPSQPSGASNIPSASPSTPASAANTIGKKSTGILAAFVTLLVF